MRVVLVVPSFPKLSESFIVRKVAGLLACGIDVHVVCSRSDDEEWQRFPELAEFPDMRARVHLSVPVRPRWKVLVNGPISVASALLRSPGPALRYGRFSARHLIIDSPMVSLAPDIVHFEFGALAVGRMHIGELLGCKVVVSFRGYDLNFSGLEEEGYYKEVWNHADTLHLLGRDLWRRAIERGCPEDKKHRLISPAVDLEFWSGERAESDESFGTPDRPLRILSVGRLEWKKGYEYALLAIRQLVDRGLICHYEIIGDGTAFESLAFARSQLDLEGVVVLAGPLNSDSVREKMHSSDLFLHAAVSEGFCNAVVEAQAMGLPSVVTNAGGLSENISDGESGYVVPCRDPDSMAQRILALAQNPEVRNSMSRDARLRAAEHFSIHKQITAFVDLYSELAGEPHP